MKRYKLTGVNVLDEPVKLAKDVIGFISGDRYFIVTRCQDAVKVVTPKDSYILKKHPVLNIYQGKCGGHKVHVSLKKITGELRYW